MEFTAVGKIEEIENIYHKEGSEYHSINLILRVENEYNEAYPNYLKIEFANKIGAEYDKVQDISDRKFNKEGDKVEVSINAAGSKWTNKEGKTIYFNKFKGWKMSSYEETEEETVTYEPMTMPEDETDIPF